MLFEDADSRLFDREYREWLSEVEQAWIEETERLRKQFADCAERAGETPTTARLLGETLEEVA